MRKLSVVVCLIILLSGNVRGQEQRPKATMFQHQTLGESFDDFMKLSGTKMCNSADPQAPQWCDAFRKIAEIGEGQVKASNGNIEATLIFSDKTLMQVVVRGPADYSQTALELNRLYGKPDVQSQASAVWNFEDGGGIALVNNSDPILTYFCKDARADFKPNELVAGISAIGQNDLSVKGHQLGESIPEFAKVRGISLEECSLPEKEAKHALKKEYKECQGLLAAFAGARTTFSGYKNDLDQVAQVMRQDFVFSFVFDGGKLSKYELTTMRHSFSDVVADLTTRFGKPLSANSATYQNGFGAQYSAGQDAWQLKDGGVILAKESFLMGSTSFRTTAITMLSASEVSGLLAQRRDSLK
jgi:hypothetical protein